MGLIFTFYKENSGEKNYNFTSSVFTMITSNKDVGQLINVE